MTWPLAAVLLGLYALVGWFVFLRVTAQLWADQTTRADLLAFARDVLFGPGGWR